MQMTQLPLYDKKIRIPELLAPAGSPEAFHAAIAAGADAVYLSGKKFGARQFAQNFTEKEIVDAVTFAHTRGVKVYVTVNTLVHDRELSHIGEYLLWLYEIGVDAVLIQDIGITKIAKEIVPNLPLHASTQMTINNVDGVKWAIEQGFSRVVLARELSIDEIKTIANETKNTEIGLEIFAHGALCYCYSGQCLFSSLIGGRSGNRGMCAQPCRKPYTFVFGELDKYGRHFQERDIPNPERYLLSPKDLCTYPKLNKLIQSPIVSLKIEGRMKSPEYVAIVVSTYRQALDTIAINNKWVPRETEIQNLALAFNREFTSGYLFGEREQKLMGRDQPDNRGLLIGRVSECNKDNNEVIIDTTIPIILSTGDGLLLRDPNHINDEIGFYLNTKPQTDKRNITFSIPRPVRRGTYVYLTSSTAQTTRAHQIISTSTFSLRTPIPIDLSVQVTDTGIPLLEGIIEPRNGNPVKVTYISSVQLSNAKTRPLTTEMFEEHLRKTGGTPFTIRKFKIDYSGGLFAPIAELNRIRREFLKQVEEALISASRPSIESIQQAEKHWKTLKHQLSTPLPVHSTHESKILKLAIYTDCLDSVRAAAVAGCDTIYFEPDFTNKMSSTYGDTGISLIKKEITSALDICHDTGITLVWKLPRILDTKEINSVCSLIQSLYKKGLNSCMVESVGSACAVKRYAPEIHLVGSVGLNVFNHRTALQLSSQFSKLAISPELSGSEIRDLISLVIANGCDVNLEMIVQGSSELMISEDNLVDYLLHCNTVSRKELANSKFIGLRDSTGRVFPIYTDSKSRTHIFNAMETCLIDHISYIMEIGIGSIAIDARGRTAMYTDQMVRIYQEAIIAAKKNDRHTHKRLIQLKNNVKEIARGGITTGHFIRGLKET